jgi:hypothetical protein
MTRVWLSWGAAPARLKFTIQEIAAPQTPAAAPPAAPETARLPVAVEQPGRRAPRNVAGNAPAGAGPRQVRQQTSLQTQRRPGNRACLDAIASESAAERRTARQFVSLRSGQGSNLRRCKVDRASICVGPKAPSRRLPPGNAASTVILAKRASGPYPLSAKKMRSRTGGRRPGGAEKKGKFALQKAQGFDAGGIGCLPQRPLTPTLSRRERWLADPAPGSRPPIPGPRYSVPRRPLIV